MPKPRKASVCSPIPRLTDPDIGPLAVTQAVLAHLAVIPDAVEANWENELRQISLAAAASGDFKSAVDGYKELGRAFGKTAENAPAQHVHFHEAEVVREATNEDLEARLAFLRRKRAEAIAPAPELAVDEPDQAEVDAFLGPAS